MNRVGQYFGRQIYWLNYKEYADQLPDKDWVCLAISHSQPDLDTFDKFVRASIKKGIHEFKGHGKFGELLHDMFDETMGLMKTVEDHPEIEVMTTWHNDESLADTFWQCFFVTCLRDSADFDNVSIVCTDLDGVNRTEELKNYIQEFEIGWLPSDNVKHEVWEDSEGKTTLCLADERGNECRQLLEPGSKLIHGFYASNHFDAMTIYYKFMNWGAYETEFEIDKEPYNKNAT